MNFKTKLIYLDGMAHSDICALLSPSEIKGYIETRHRTKKTTFEDVQRLSTHVIKEDM